VSLYYEDQTKNKKERKSNEHGELNCNELSPAFHGADHAEKQLGQPK
jgi:hypothetical protein